MCLKYCGLTVVHSVSVVFACCCCAAGAAVGQQQGAGALQHALLPGQVRAQAQARSFHQVSPAVVTSLKPVVDGHGGSKDGRYSRQAMEL
jgi:poly(3-hydroxybutyrate) depolymerase